MPKFQKLCRMADNKRFTKIAIRLCYFRDPWLVAARVAFFFLLNCNPWINLYKEVVPKASHAQGLLSELG